MKTLIFYLDDTLLMSHTYKKYTDIVPNDHLNYVLDKLDNPKYIYTNGTYGHGEDGLKHMECSNSFKHIYARDTIPFMKPEFKSYNHVNNSIYFDHDDVGSRIFFDDLPNNLYTAHNIGWETVWIHPEASNDHKPYYIDHAYKNVIDALYTINLN